MTDQQSLATGAPLTADTFAEFVSRLRHDCEGEGVRDHCTADALFIVQEKRRVYGIDKDYTDDWAILYDESVWFSPEEYYEDLDEEGKRDLDSLAKADDCRAETFSDLDASDKWALIENLDDHSVVGYSERWEYVNAHLTKDAAEAFIRRKKHDYPDGLRVYVESQCYAWEFNAIKQAILDGALTFKENRNGTS